jgi:hypothetical protein
MFPTLSASLLLSLGFGVAAIELPSLQNPLLTVACVAATAFCCSFEAWSSGENALQPRQAALRRKGASEEGQTSQWRD